MNLPTECKPVNNWKELDLTAKYAQLNALRKIYADVAFHGLSEQILEMIEYRVTNLSEDLNRLYRLDVPSGDDPSIPE